MDAPLPEGLTKAWEEFLASESSRTPGMDLYPEVFEHPLLFPLQRMGEAAAMIQIAREYSPKVVMDVGSDKGGGLYHWIKCLPSVQRVIACEVRGTPYNVALQRAFPSIDFLWLPFSSYKASTVDEVKWFLDDPPATIDVLFLDGDKARFDQDFWLYARFMTPRSVVFFHDVADPSPRQAFESVCASLDRIGWRNTDAV